MGYALFTARKMSLQAQKNNYNLQLMKIENRLTQLTNESADYQQSQNKIDAGQNTGSTLLKFGATVGGFCVAGPMGAMVGNAAGSLGSDLINKSIDKGQQMSDEAYQNKVAAEQAQLDTEKQRLTTLINQVDAELKNVTDAEKNAIKDSAPSYVG